MRSPVRVALAALVVTLSVLAVGARRDVPAQADSPPARYVSSSVGAAPNPQQAADVVSYVLSANAAHWYEVAAAQEAANAAAAKKAAAHHASTAHGHTAGGGSKACVANSENGGDYGRSTNPTHFGRYQFSQSTWVAYGGDPSTWGSASPQEQDRVFENAWNSPGGPSNWTKWDGC